MPDVPMRLCLPFLSVMALMFLIGCAEHDPARRFASGQVSTNTSDAATAAALISQHRVAHGLSPVTVDLRLTEAATAQARTVAEAALCPMANFRAG